MESETRAILPPLGPARFELSATRGGATAREPVAGGERRKRAVRRADASPRPQLQMLVLLQPVEGEVAPDRREVEGRQAVEDHGGERGLLGDAGLDEPPRQPGLGDADAAGV